MATETAEQCTVVPPQLGIAGLPLLVFQPAVDLRSGRLLGFEAFLRWMVPGRGVVMPNAFIPWAEANGFMGELNAWVLAEACMQASRWPSQYQVAVNCSIFQLQTGEVAEAAAAALEQAGLNPDRLTIEVRQIDVAEDLAADLAAMARLGIQLTMDDVCSDQSVLASLEHLGGNTIKIDGSLVGALENPDSSSTRALVGRVIELAHPLGICTVAECVETPGQVAILQELGADVAQGYYFSRPLSAEEALLLATTNLASNFSWTPHGDVRAQQADEEQTPTASEDAVAGPAPDVKPPDPGLEVTPQPPSPSDRATAQAPTGGGSQEGVDEPSRDPRVIEHLTAALVTTNRGLAELAVVVTRLNQLIETSFPDPELHPGQENDPSGGSGSGPQGTPSAEAR